jgi:hypothetical protein
MHWILIGMLIYLGFALAAFGIVLVVALILTALIAVPLYFIHPMLGLFGGIAAFGTFLILFGEKMKSACAYHCTGPKKP